MNEEQILVVSGLPRSGTSMMMSMLEAGGLPLLVDGVRTADGDNPKGYFEFERVKKLREGDTAWLSAAGGKVVKIISYLLLFLPEEYRYRVIFMQRDLDEILASQRKMLLNRGEDPDKMGEEKLKEIMQKHLSQVEAWCEGQPHLDRLEVPYREVIAEPGRFLDPICNFLKVDLDRSKMAAVVDPGLYRQRMDK